MSTISVSSRWSLRNRKTGVILKKTFATRAKARQKKRESFFLYDIISPIGVVVR